MDKDVLENSECVYLECSRSAHVWRCHDAENHGLGKSRIGELSILVEKVSLKRSSEIGTRILESTLNSLDEEEAMKKFFEAGRSLRSWVYSNDEENALFPKQYLPYRCECGSSLACARGDQLGMLEELLRHYLGHGDSVLLANLIDITPHSAPILSIGSFAHYLPNVTC